MNYKTAVKTYKKQGKKIWNDVPKIIGRHNFGFAKGKISRKSKV